MLYIEYEYADKHNKICNTKKYFYDFRDFQEWVKELSKDSKYKPNLTTYKSMYKFLERHLYINIVNRKNY